MDNNQQTSETAGERRQKKEKFADQGPGSNSKSGRMLALAVLVVMGAFAFYVIFSGNGNQPAPILSQPAAGAGEDVRIPLSQISGQAKFYEYPLPDNSKISFFVLKSPDGVYRAAFDACVVCYHAKKGYRQEGDMMVCNNCGQSFQANRINQARGGCNPAPLERTVDGDSLLIRASDIQQGATLFSNLRSN